MVLWISNLLVYYTWFINRHSVAAVYKRLDNVVGNQQQLNVYKDARVHILPITNLVLLFSQFILVSWEVSIVLLKLKPYDYTGQFYDSSPTNQEKNIKESHSYHMARKFKNLKKEIKYRKRPCYNSYAHNKYFLQQGGATKQKYIS